MAEPDRLRFAPWRLPFTSATLAVLLVVGVLTGTHLGALPSSLVERYGFAPSDLLGLEWSRVVTSVFLTQGGLSFWVAFILVALFGYAAEYSWGTGRTALTFWTAHVTALVVTFGASHTLHLLGHGVGSLVYLARDIGPSAGYFGCLGLAVTALPRPARRWAGAAVLAGLLVALVSAVIEPTPSGIEISASAAHFIAFPLGVGAASVFRASSRRTARQRGAGVVG